MQYEEVFCLCDQGLRKEFSKKKWMKKKKNCNLASDLDYLVKNSILNGPSLN